MYRQKGDVWSYIKLMLPSSIFRTLWICLQTKRGSSGSTTTRRSGTWSAIRCIQQPFIPKGRKQQSQSTLTSRHLTHSASTRWREQTAHHNAYSVCVFSGEISGEESTSHLHPEATRILRPRSHSQGWRVPMSCTNSTCCIQFTIVREAENERSGGLSKETRVPEPL